MSRMQGLNDKNHIIDLLCDKIMAYGWTAFKELRTKDNDGKLWTQDITF